MRPSSVGQSALQQSGGSHAVGPETPDTELPITAAHASVKAEKAEPPVATAADGPMELDSMYNEVRVAEEILERVKKTEEDVDPAIRRKRDLHNVHVRAHRRRQKEALEALKNEVEQKTQQLKRVLSDFLVQDTQLRLQEAVDGVSRDTLWRSYGLLVQQREQLRVENAALRRQSDEYAQFVRKMDQSLDAVSDEFKASPDDAAFMDVDEMSDLPQDIDFQPLSESACQAHIRDAYQRTMRLRRVFEESCSIDRTTFTEEHWNNWKVCYDYQYVPIEGSNGQPSSRLKRDVRFRFVKEVTRQDLSVDEVKNRFWQVQHFPEEFGELYHPAVRHRVLQRSGDTSVTHRTYPAGLGGACAQLLAVVTRMEDVSTSATEGDPHETRMLAVGKVLDPEECVADFRGSDLGPRRWIRDGLSYFSFDCVDASAGTMRLEYGGMISCMSKFARQDEEVVSQVVLATGQALLRIEQSVFGPHILLRE